MSSDIMFPCRLPSQGQLYAGPLIPQGDIQVKPIRGEHEEMLAGAGEQNSGRVLRQVTAALTVFPDPAFPFQTLLVSDWVAITFNIMAASYSPTITLTPVCPKCAYQLQETRTLDQIPCKSIQNFRSEDGTLDYKEPFEVYLPASGVNVGFKLLRLQDLERIEDYAQQYKRKQMMVGDPTYTYTLASYIFSINGNPSLSDLEKMRWVRSAIARDLHTLRAAVERMETGYDLKPEMVCPSCNTGFRTQVPIDFFRAFSS